ncbi:TIGR02206 family membrane protein [Ornithinimicrobium sp. Y1694]|uniref:TMEM164-related integral membrane acyltransferase n=1 Tax=Ornithinimicrobium sp. Y1694 TaxID=3418590 RepID=UPI003CE72072
MDTFLDPHPEWISVGGPDHLSYVGGVVLLAVLLLTNRDRVRRHARTIRRVALGFVIIQQCTMYGFYAATGWRWDDSLPMHISRISVLLALVYLATGSRRVMDVLFFFGTWAYTSFAYPQNIQPVDNILGWSFFVNHAVVLLIPAFAWITTDWRPSLAGLRRAIVWFFIYALAAVVTNALTGGNYFYQRDKPLLPMVDQPWFFLLSLLAGLALFGLGYAVSRLIPDRGRDLS